MRIRAIVCMVVFPLLTVAAMGQPTEIKPAYVELKPLKPILSDGDYNEEQARRIPGTHKCAIVPNGWEGIYESSEDEWCRRSIENMYRPNLGETLYRFYLYEIQNKRHSLITRSNMASALILHRHPSGWGVPQLLKKMAEDKTETELWKAHCLRYLSILETLSVPHDQVPTVQK